MQNLMAICHAARKGGYIGSHWFKHHRASSPLDVSSLLSNVLGQFDVIRFRRLLFLLIRTRGQPGAKLLHFLLELPHQNHQIGQSPLSGVLPEVLPVR